MRCYLVDELQPEVIANLEAQLTKNGCQSGIERAIKAHMTAIDADTLTGADYKITWKTVTSSRFDSTAFKKAMPELAERFTKSTTSRRFTVA